MPVPEAFSKLVDTTVTQAAKLVEAVRDDASEHVARFSGRAAGWADQAGFVTAEVAQEAAAKASAASRHLADDVGERIIRVGEKLSRRD